MELVSDGCRALTGYGTSDLTGNRVVAFADLIHREDRQRVSEQCQASLEARQPCSSEYRIVTAGGEEKWVWDQAHGVYGPSGELLAVEGLVTDITQRKRAEEIAAALQAVGRRMVGTLDVAEATDIIATAVLALFRVRRSVLFRLDPETSLLRCVGRGGGDARQWVGRTLRQARGRGRPWPSDDPWHRRTSDGSGDRSRRVAARGLVTLAVPPVRSGSGPGRPRPVGQCRRAFRAETRLQRLRRPGSSRALQNAELYRAARDLADRRRR